MNQSQRMTECVEFLNTLDEGDMVDLMMELFLKSGDMKLIDVKVAAAHVLESAKILGDIA